MNKTYRPNPYACFGREPHPMDFSDSEYRENPNVFSERMRNYLAWNRENQQVKASPLFLLSAPFSHIDPAVKIIRKVFIAEMAIKMINHGIFVISPVSYGVSLVEYAKTDKKTDFETWKEFCLCVVNASAGLYVINIEGWNESTGVKEEISMALDLEKPVFLIEYDPDPNTPIKIIKQIKEKL
jgi:hypothetical protein